MIFLKRLFLVGLLFFELTTEMNSVIHKKNGIFVKKRRLVVNVSNPVVHVQEPEEIIDQQIKEKRPIMTSVLDEEPLKIGYTVKVNNVFVNRILPLKFSKEINVNINNVNLLIKINQFSVRNQKELTCGVHAVNNLKCFIDGDNDLDLVNKLLFDDCRYKKIYELFTNTLQVDCENLSNFDITDKLNIIFGYDLASIITVISSSFDFINFGNNTFNYKFYGFDRKSELFKCGMPQYFIVNITSRSNGYGHWVPFKFELKNGKIVVTTANSLYNSNVIEYGNTLQFVEKIISILTK